MVEELHPKVVGEGEATQLWLVDAEEEPKVPEFFKKNHRRFEVQSHFPLGRLRFDPSQVRIVRPDNYQLARWLRGDEGAWSDDWEEEWGVPLNFGVMGWLKCDQPLFLEKWRETFGITLAFYGNLFCGRMHGGVAPESVFVPCLRSPSKNRGWTECYHELSGLHEGNVATSPPPLGVFYKLSRKFGLRLVNPAELEAA